MAVVTISLLLAIGIKLMALPSWRWWLSTIISTLMWALGWWLVVQWTNRTGLSPLLGRNVVSAILLWPTYKVHSKIIWRDRPTAPGTGLQWSKSTAWLWVLHTAVYGMAIYAIGLHYLEAGIILTLPFAIYAYFRRDRRDFLTEANRSAEAA